MNAIETKEPVKRSFTLPASLYVRLERIAEREARTVNAQTVRWIAEKIKEYEDAEERRSA